MNIAQTSFAEVTAQRLQALAELYRLGQVSEVMDRTLEKLLAYEAELCQTQLNQLQTDLAAFEQQYQLSSDEFYRRFQAGQTDDSMDFVEWASLVQMAHNLKQRLKLLTEAVKA